jgi:hypothetical protein
MFKITKNKPLVYRNFIRELTAKKAQEKDTYKLLTSDSNRNCDIRIALADEQGWVCCYCLCRLPEKEFAYKKMVTEETVPKISAEMNIEHYKPKSLFKGKNIAELLAENKENPANFLSPATYARLDKLEDLRTDWDNLLGACLHHNRESNEQPNEGESDEEAQKKYEAQKKLNEQNQRCGDLKANFELHHIANPAHLNRFNGNKITCNKFGVVGSEDDNIKEELGGVLDITDDTAEFYQKGRLNLNCAYLREARKGVIEAVDTKIHQLAGIKTKEYNHDKVVKAAEKLFSYYQQRINNKHQPFYAFVLVFLAKTYPPLRKLL